MSKYKILWQSSTAVSGLPAYSAAIKKHAEKILGPDVNLTIRGVDAGTMDLHFLYFQSMNDQNVLNSILKASAEGYDGVAVGCFMDSGVQQAREITDMPVIGMAEMGMLFACLYGKKFSVVTYVRQMVEKRYDELIRAYSLQGRSAPMQYFDISLDALANSFDNPGPVLDAFTRASQKAVDQGAEVILPGCGLLNLIAVQNGLNKVGRATVLDVSGALMKTLEAMIVLREKCGVTVSRQGLYESPTQDQIDAAKKIYGVEW